MKTPDSTDRKGLSEIDLIIHDLNNIQSVVHVAKHGARPGTQVTPTLGELLSMISEKLQTTIDKLNRKNREQN